MVSQSSVSEALAWDIALTWRASLQNRVTLVTDRTGVESRIVKSYQWIQLDLRSPHDASHGRSAVIAWFWLSCCRGYSGLENPQFWKRVFSELATATPQATDAARCEEPITDAVRFFDVKGAELPRVQFDYLDAAATRRTHSRSRALGSFVGVKEEDSTETTTTLSGIFDKLKRYIIPSRMQRAIPMSVHAVDFPTVRALLLEAQSTDASALSLPRFEAIPRAHSSATWVPELASERVRRTVPNYFQSLFMNASDEIKSFSRLRLERDRLAPNLIQRVCSAAPQSRSIETLILKTTSHRSRYDSRTSLPVSEPVNYPEFSRMEWAWIGYTLFHPEAQKSALRALKIGLHGITREAIEILKLMKRGNHLHVIAAGSLKASSKCYHIAQLREGSLVRRTASERGDQLVVSSDDLRVTLCVEDPTMRPVWVRAVVPGIGLAWIRSCDIISITSRPPSASHIESLDVDFESVSESNAALAFVRVVGGNLKHLNISACADLRAPKLRLVLEACPRLTSLGAKHDGSLWAHSDTTSLPRLKELYLSLEGTVFHAPSRDALRTSLQKLSVLRIDAKQACFVVNKSAVLDLIEAHGMLEYLHWSDPESSERQPKLSFEAGLAHTREQLGGLTQRGHSETQALAFLHVVRSKQSGSSALGSLNSDVTASILAFAKARTARTYWVVRDRKQPWRPTIPKLMESTSPTRAVALYVIRRQ